MKFINKFADESNYGGKRKLSDIKFIYFQIHLIIVIIETYK